MSVVRSDSTAGDRSPRQNIELVKDNTNKQLVLEATSDMGGCRRTHPNINERVRTVHHRQFEEQVQSKHQGGNFALRSVIFVTPSRFLLCEGAHHDSSETEDEEDDPLNCEGHRVHDVYGGDALDVGGNHQVGSG